MDPRIRRIIFVKVQPSKKAVFKPIVAATVINRRTDFVARSISGNRIRHVPDGLLQRTPALALLELRGNPLVGVDSQAFTFLSQLRKLQVLFLFDYPVT